MYNPEVYAWLHLQIFSGAVMSLDFQLLVQLVPITTNVVGSNLVHGEVYSIQHYVINLSVTCDRSVVFCGYYSGFLHQ